MIRRLRWGSFPTMILLSATFSLAVQAQIDLSGDYRVDDLDGVGAMDACTATMVQAGASLTFGVICDDLWEASATGTIDTVTGDFSLTGSCDSSGSFAYTGTGSPDGLTFSMTGTCSTLRLGTRPLCPTLGSQHSRRSCGVSENLRCAAARDWRTDAPVPECKNAGRVIRSALLRKGVGTLGACGSRLCTSWLELPLAG